VSALLSVWVPGVPRPKGSYDVNRNGTLRPAQRESAAWQRTVALFVKRAIRDGGLVWQPYAGAVQLAGAALFARPEGNESVYPMGKAYDGDKLLRALADGLSACGSRGSGKCTAGCRKHGALLADDDRIVTWGPFGVLWAVDGQAGAQIEVTSL
jgi:hypothetical protein